MNWMFYLTSIGLGIGLAMDAFSASLANSLSEPKMRAGKMCTMVGVFAAFQFAMPMLGWVCVHTVVQYFSWFEKLIPWLALVLLGFIGGKMLIEGLRCKCGEDESCTSVGLVALLIQGVATSIDALSVGFTIAEYDWLPALVCCFLIAAVTFAICMGGVIIGKKIGTKLEGKASVFGGVILIAIGLEIFVTGLIG